MEGLDLAQVSLMLWLQSYAGCRRICLNHGDSLLLVLHVSFLWDEFYFSQNCQPIHPAGSNSIYMCTLISHWRFCMCVMLVMSCQSCWGIIMPKEGARWILCLVFLFYDYHPGCQDAKVPDGAAVYMVLMKLLRRAFSCFSPSLQAHGGRRIGHPII